MSADFAWRKKELHSLKFMVVANETTPHRDLFIRAADDSALCSLGRFHQSYWWMLSGVRCEEVSLKH